jgi:hypothetical protein
MKIKVPETLTAEIPPTLLGRIMSATPVVMTVIATMLAGLASSEMTKAQYDRSLAAQQQSKAGDQWSYFQAKRLRGTLQRNTLDLLQAAHEIHPLDPAALQQSLSASATNTELIALLNSDAGKNALVALQKGEPPVPAGSSNLTPDVKAVIEAIENLRPESEIATLLTKVDDQTIVEMIAAGKTRTDAFDDATKPINEIVDAADRALQREAGVDGLRRNFTAARVRFAAQRYDAEARLNQVIAMLYELQVRKNNLSAERHHARSQRFFYGMLGAQLAVIISTFAIAARQRNLLWTLAAAAGVAALLFAGYVYLYV